MIEAGGKDSVIVDADADIEAAADAALWGACSNAGQTCIGVERVYVHEKVYDEFVADDHREGRRAWRPTEGGKIGPITMPSQVGVIRSHVQDALDRGGRAVRRRRRRRGRAVRAADDPGRRTRGLAGGAGGDLRPDPDHRQGAHHGRGDREDQRDPLRPGQHGLQQGQRHGDRGAGPLRHDRRSTA